MKNQNKKLAHKRNIARKSTLRIKSKEKKGI